MAEESCRARLRRFLAGVVPGDLGDEDDIFALGYVNSLFAMELVSFVESEFSVPIGNEDLELANFCSIDAIASLVARKTSARGAPESLPSGSDSEPTPR